MIVNVNWSSFKSVKDQSGGFIFYSVENKYASNDPSIPNVDRYFLEMSNNSDTLECCITISNPRNADQIDFEDNYKSGAIEKV